MKQSNLFKAMVACSTIALSGSVFAQWTATTVYSGGFVPDPFTPGTSIAQTKHNLGSTNSVGSNSFSGTDEICVFCHTPHGGAGESSAAPLWNRQLAAPSTYTIYQTQGSSTMEGTVNPVGSVSLACLSCHDGTQAMNSNYNGPGAGAGAGYLATSTGGYNSASQATPMDGNWTVMGQLNNPAEIAFIGTDLRNDHPIGMAFCGGGAPATGGAGCANPDFNDGKLKSKTMNGITVFWVDTDGNATRNKEDLKLFPDNRSGTITTAANVECATCHDPHTAANPTFLRVSNTGSKVCLTCHNK